MNTIKRDVYVLRNTIKIPIEVTKGTDAISFEFTVRDYNLPATAAAVAYAYRGGMKKPNSTLCNVEDNVISFQPSANFFEVGMNELQIRVINEDKSLISFKEKVKCADSLGFPDEEEEKQKSLVEQLVAYTGKETAERKEADAQERAERIQAIETEKKERMNADATEKAERQKDIDVERARINQLAKLPAGSTSGDAELQDIRVGADGKTYETAGEAVREQIGSLNEDIVSKSEGQIKSLLVKDSYVDKDGTIAEYIGWSRTNYIDVSQYSVLSLYIPMTIRRGVWLKEDKTTVIFPIITTTKGNITLFVPLDAKYLIISGLTDNMKNTRIYVKRRKSDNLNFNEKRVNVNYIVNGYIQYGKLQKGDRWAATDYMEIPKNLYIESDGTGRS